MHEKILQGIKNKNLQIINKKHLIGITIEQAKKSKMFDKIVVSSDCKKINTIGKNMEQINPLRE